MKTRLIIENKGYLCLRREIKEQNKLQNQIEKSGRNVEIEKIFCGSEGAH